MNSLIPPPPLLKIFSPLRVCPHEAPHFFGAYIARLGQIMNFPAKLLRRIKSPAYAKFFNLEQNKGFFLCGLTI